MSAPISLHPNQREGEEERERQRRSQRLRLFRKGDKGRKEKRKIEKQNTHRYVFFFLGGREQVNVDLGPSLSNYLSHNSECVDACL